MGTGGSFWTCESSGPHFFAHITLILCIQEANGIVFPFQVKGSLNYSKHLGIYFFPDAGYGLLGHNIDQFWLFWKLLVFRHYSNYYFI